MKKFTLFITCLLALLFLALPVQAQPDVYGFSLGINEPVFNTFSGANNVPDFTLSNTSTTANITKLNITIGDPRFLYDFVRSEEAVSDVGNALEATLNSPDRKNDNQGLDEIDYGFSGFSPGDVFQFEADIDQDNGSSSADYQDVLFPNAVVTVTFDNGTTLAEPITSTSTNVSDTSDTESCIPHCSSAAQQDLSDSGCIFVDGKASAGVTLNNVGSEDVVIDLGAGGLVEICPDCDEYGIYGPLGFTDTTSVNAIYPSLTLYSLILDCTASGGSASVMGMSAEAVVVKAGKSCKLVFNDGIFEDNSGGYVVSYYPHLD